MGDELAARRLGTTSSEGNNRRRIRGVADKRDAARHAAGGRWGELYAKGDGLPGRKGEGETQPADAEARSSNTSLRNGQVGAAGVGQGEVSQADTSDLHFPPAGVGGRH